MTKTFIQVDVSTREKLKLAKIVKKESYNEAILRLLESQLN